MWQKKLNLKNLSNSDITRLISLCSETSDQCSSFEIEPIEIRDLLFLENMERTKCYFINKDETFEFLPSST